jgi:hypothetical protein
MYGARLSSFSSFGNGVEGLGWSVDQLKQGMIWYVERLFHFVVFERGGNVFKERFPLF